MGIISKWFYSIYGNATHYPMYNSIDIQEKVMFSDGVIVSTDIEKAKSVRNAYYK